MSENEELILSLKAVLFACVNHVRKTSICAFYTNGRTVKKRRSIGYDDAIRNVFELIQKLESEDKP